MADSFRPTRTSRLEMDVPPLEDICLDEPTEYLERSQGRPGCFKNALHEILFVVFCTFAGATFPFLQRSTVVVTDSIRKDLGMTQSQVSWISASSGLTTGAFLLPFAFAAENCPNISRKLVLLASLLLYCSAVGLAAISVDGVFLDFMLGMAGVACAAHIANSVSLLNTAYPGSSLRKKMAFAVFLSGGNPLGTLLGGLGSAIVTERFVWRATFCLIASIFTPFLFLGLVVVPGDPRHLRTENYETKTPAEKSLERRQFDWVAVVLLPASVGLLATGLTFIPEVEWTTLYMHLVFALGIISFVGLVIWENTTSSPMMPTTIWKNKTLALLIVFNIFTAMGAYSVIFWVPLFMQVTQGLSPVEVAIQLVPQALAGLCISPTVGFIMQTVNGTWILVASAFLQVASGLLLVFLRPGSNYWTFAFPALIFSTVSLDWALGVASQFILSSLPSHRCSAGAATLQTLTRLAILLGLAITTAVHTPPYVESELGAPLELSFTKTFYAVLGFSVINILLVPFIKIGKQGTIWVAEPVPGGLRPENRTHPEQLATKNRTRRARTMERRPFGPVLPRTSSLHASRYYQQLGLTNTNQVTPKLEIPSQSSHGTEGHRSVRTNATERVIWLACKNCDASKRTVERVGDPSRYFSGTENTAPKTGRSRTAGSESRYSEGSGHLN